MLCRPRTAKRNEKKVGRKFSVVERKDSLSLRKPRTEKKITKKKRKSRTVSQVSSVLNTLPSRALFSL